MGSWDTMGALAAGLAPLAVITALDAWVYLDAKGRQGTGREVGVTVGDRFTIDSPAAWLAGCAVLSVVFFPLYLLARRQAG